MWYIVRDGYCVKNYKFIYNDESRIVRYASPLYIDRIRSNLSIKELYISSNDLYVKYRMLFEQKGAKRWIKNICVYSVGSFQIRMMFDINRGACSIRLFYTGKNAEELGEIPRGVGLSLEAFGFDGGFGNKNSVELIIPFVMLDYLMNLASRHDFDGMMDSLDNLIGVDLYKFVPNIDVPIVKVDEWFV